MMKKIYILFSLLKYLNFSIKISIFKPKEEKFLVYDYLTGKIFSKLFHVTEANYIFTRKEKVNLYIFFITIFNKIDGNKNFYFYYINNYIRITNPKIILTINDQDTNFWLLKNFFPKIIFVVIQNSLTFAGENSVRLRLKESGNTFKNLEVDYLFLYGKGKVQEFKKYLKVVKEVIPIGSFKNNLIKLKKIKKSNKIVYISHFKNNLPTLRNELQYNIDKSTLDLLFNFSKKNKFKIFILNKQKEPSKLQIEEDYFKGILRNKNFTFMKVKNAYDHLDKYNYYVNTDSTLGYEALARGLKVAFLNYRTNYLHYRDNYYGFPLIKRRKGPFWTNSRNVKEFNRVMNFVVFSKNRDWQFIKVKYIKPIIEYDYGNKKFLITMTKYIKGIKLKK